MAQPPTVEAALTLAKEQHAQATQAGGVGVWDWNPTTGDIFVDPVLKGLLGFTDAEIPNRAAAWMARVHPDDRAIVEAEAAALLADEKPTYDVEHRMTHKDGSTRWFLARGAAARNASGEPERIVGTTTDITDQKTAQAALTSALNEFERVVRDRTTELEEVGRRYRDLFESAPVMYVTIRARDGEPTVEDCNDLFLRMLGYTRREVIGAPLTDFYTAQSRRDLQDAALEGPLDAAERQLVAKYGGVLDTLLHAVPETDAAGSIIGTRAMYVDITERKRSEAKHRETQSKRRLLVEQSLIQYRGRPAVAGVPLDISERLRLEHQLLQAQKLESVGTLAGAWPTHSTTRSPRSVGDAMPDGGPLTVATRDVELDGAFHRIHPDVPVGPYVGLLVTDTGDGMSEERVTHVFEPFFTTKEFGRGSGLGLATVHGIVRQTGGHVLVDSAVGRGTTVSIYLPRLRDDAVTMDEGDAIHGEPLETILLVEDEPHVRRTIGDMLVQVGYRVLTAPNADEAMLMSSQHRGTIDLLLTDVVMPGMNGWQLAAELTWIRRGMRVLYMTGHTKAHLPDALRDDQSLLRKPFAPKALRRAVRRVLDQEP